MNIKITSKDGATLKTANKYVKEDIAIVLDESFAQPSGTLEITEKGEYDVKELEKVNVNIESGSGEDMLQARIDATNSCYYLFYNYTGNNVDYISRLDTSNVTNMSYMFRGCKTLTTIPSLNTSNVTNMGNMFNNCSALTSVPQLNTSNVTDMSHMFGYCRALTTIPQLDTSNVTNMYNMFSNCKTLTTIPSLNTSNVTNMNSMFNSCSALTTIPQLDTSNVTDMSYMFGGCTNLSSLIKLNTRSATTLQSTFASTSFNIIEISYYNTTSSSYSSNILLNCSKLKAFVIRNFGENYVLNSTPFNNSSISSGTGYIYVPRNMVDKLKSATNWSTYASQIRALEDYTVDGTTTGALDETKI